MLPLRQNAATALAAFDSASLPIGWPTGSHSYGFIACTVRLIGWIITALATLLGASYWFDALSGLVKLRGVSPNPADKGQS